MNIGRRSFLGLAAATGAAGCLGTPPPGGSQLVATELPPSPGGKDENLTVFVTDIHVSGLPDAFPKPCERLARFVDEVLAMNPRPARVVSLGDLAYLHGLPEDYAKSKPLLKKLADAGIELVFAMGNHDRRSALAGVCCEIPRAGPDREHRLAWHGRSRGARWPAGLG